MSSAKKTILLKVTGEILPCTERGFDGSFLETLTSQLKKLLATHRFSIVVGGGNIFRGAHPGKLSISTNVGHSVGMLATMMNGLIVQDVFEQAGISTQLFTASCNEAVGITPSPQAIREALSKKECLIFAGGSGNPYITTDTTAVIRALQVGAQELWKGTHVDGIYSQDPKEDTSASLLKSVSYKEVLNQRYGVMDLAAFALAEQYKVYLRIFNIFKEEALIKAAQDATFGSTVFY